ncbi:unnamed protein product [Soboliphyme baturini]|uniref:40S ribosomal protein S6 n=1 Tax=Soboliphyme baturini TaxID=241478 RepID=A0A183ITD0_9BILA|nr:unnamed protein product [Soboliphyme baturini]
MMRVYKKKCSSECLDEETANEASAEPLDPAVKKTDVRKLQTFVSLPREVDEDCTSERADTEARRIKTFLLVLSSSSSRKPQSC